jgi:tRNA-splicing ligase RtcB
MEFIKKDRNVWIILQKDRAGASGATENWKGDSRAPIIVIANDEIKDGIQEGAIKLAFHAKETFGVEDIILTPDVHMGNFIPTGCVLTSRKNIYPGSIGDDIGCGMRLVRTNVSKDSIGKELLGMMIDEIDQEVPTGFDHNQVPLVPGDKLRMILNGTYQTDHDDLREHPPYRCSDGFLDEEYLKQAEETLGTLGGGNHFIEFQFVDEVFNEEVAGEWGLFKDQLVIMIHSGSRSFGARIAHEHIKELQQFFSDWGIPHDTNVEVYCPSDSDIGKAYLNGMRMALNFSIENRAHMQKKVMGVLTRNVPGIECELLYDICHNTITHERVRREDHWVHRKGATRAFPPGHHFLEGTKWEKTGHPVLLPGSMGSRSFIMRGLDGPNSISAYYSINHGAGRKMGRKQAYRELSDEEAISSLGDVITNQSDIGSIKDEVSLVYKDIDEIIDSVEGAGIAGSVVALRPLGVVKGANR